MRKTINDLRKALPAGIRIHRQGGDWIIERWSESLRCWVQAQPVLGDTERSAIERALRIAPD